MSITWFIAICTICFTAVIFFIMKPKQTIGRFYEVGDYLGYAVASGIIGFLLAVFVTGVLLMASWNCECSGGELVGSYEGDIILEVGPGGVVNIAQYEGGTHKVVKTIASVGSSRYKTVQSDGLRVEEYSVTEKLPLSVVRFVYRTVTYSYYVIYAPEDIVSLL